MWKTQPTKIVVKLLENLRIFLDEWNGYPEIFSFSQALEISREYLLLLTVILLKHVAGCPCSKCMGGFQSKEGYTAVYLLACW